MSSGLGSGIWNPFGSRKACKGDQPDYLYEGYRPVTMFTRSIRKYRTIYRIYLRAVSIVVKTNATISFKDSSKYLTT